MKNQEIVEYYNKSGSLKETAAAFGVGWQKVRKILISEGAYTSDIAEKVQELHKSGTSYAEIAEKLKINKNAVNSYLPYTKTVYNGDDASKNALKIRRWREEKRQNSAGQEN